MYQNTLKFIIYSFLVCTLLISSAQTPTLNPFFFGVSDKTSDVTPFNLSSIGKYYADTKWNAGNIYLENGDSLIGYYMRYDLIRNHLEVIIDTKIMAINGSFISGFEWFSTDRLRREKYIVKDKTEIRDFEEVPGFVEILVEGYAKLYKCKIVIAPQQSTSPSLLPEVSKKIHILETYYYELSDSIFEVENGNRKNLKRLQSSKLDEFVSNQNLKFRVEADLIRIFYMYNEINGHKKTE